MAPSDAVRSKKILPEYLCVDSFIRDMVTARALTTAFELRLIDTLNSCTSAPYDVLKQVIPSTHNGLKLLLRLLMDGGVLHCVDNRYGLTPGFVEALQYRDLLLAKLDFAHIAAHDFIDSFSFLMADPQEFMQRSGMFRLFDYGTAIESTPENRRRTERWMRITTMLTRYEAQSCFSLHNLNKYRHMLDIGGNSGEFALQACRNYPDLRASVFDLPVVCDIGCDHLRNEPESGRINFIRGNALTGDLPKGFELITFKSMLHDWPDDEVRLFIRKACNALEPGGELLIFERGPFEVGEDGLSYSGIPVMLFANTLRPPDLYLECLSQNGFKQISVQWLELEMPFFIVSAYKSESDPGSFPAEIA